MLKKVRRPKPYRIVIIFVTLFLLLIETYVIFVSFRTVNVSSFDVEIASSNKIEINEGKKTFSVSNYSDSFIKTSKEYKEVLAVSSNNIAVIDTDNQLKLIDVNENIMATFTYFSLDIQYITSTTLFEEQNIIRIKFAGSKDGNDFDIDYCYNKDTNETYMVRKF